jgi:hypothetical protein
MPITITCACQKKLRVREELAGKRVKCPGCGKPVAVPAERAAGRAPARPASRPAGRRWLADVGLGLAFVVCLLALVGGLYWWFWVPSAAEEAVYKDFARRTNELVDMHAGLHDKAAAEAARPRLRQKAQECVDLWEKMGTLPDHKRAYLDKKYGRDVHQAMGRIAELLGSTLQGRGPAVLVIWGNDGERNTVFELPPSGSRSPRSISFNDYGVMYKMDVGDPAPSPAP